MATHSIILAQKTCMDRVGLGLQSKGSQRIREDRATEHHAYHYLRVGFIRKGTYNHLKEFFPTQRPIKTQGMTSSSRKACPRPSPIPISSKDLGLGVIVSQHLYSTSWDPNTLVRVLKHNGGFCFVFSYQGLSWWMVAVLRDCRWQVALLYKVTQRLMLYLKCYSLRTSLYGQEFG